MIRPLNSIRAKNHQRQIQLNLVDRPVDVNGFGAEAELDLKNCPKHFGEESLACSAFNYREKIPKKRSQSPLPNGRGLPKLVAQYAYEVSDRYHEFLWRFEVIPCSSVGRATDC